MVPFDNNTHHSNKFKEIIANLSFYVFHSFSTFNMLNILTLYIDESTCSSMHLDYIIMLNGNNIINNNVCNVHVYSSNHVPMWYLRILLQKRKKSKTFVFSLHPFSTPTFG